MRSCSNHFLHLYAFFHSLQQVYLLLQINKAILFIVHKSNIQKMPISTKAPQSIHFKPFMMSCIVQSILHVWLRLHVKELIASQKHRTLQKKVGKTYQVSEIDKQKLLEDAKYFKGGKYVWGGTTPEGFDCSGYVQYLYKKHNINLPRTAWAQSKKGQIVKRNNLQKGDLLFFLTDKKRGIPITHVGIYIGDGNFIHAASKDKGIIISPLTHGSYAKTFVSARRVTPKV